MAGGDIAGITVNTVARISAHAAADQIVASSVVADLLAGTGLELTDLEITNLRGFPVRGASFPYLDSSRPAPNGLRPPSGGTRDSPAASLRCEGAASVRLDWVPGTVIRSPIRALPVKWGR